MNILGVEETLRAYFEETGKHHTYDIVSIDELPIEAIEIRYVCINGVHIRFYEKFNEEETKSTVFWMVEFVKAH